MGRPDQGHGHAHSRRRRRTCPQSRTARVLLILVHTAHESAREWAGPGFGRLLSPRQFSRVSDTAATGIPWAADNDAYAEWNERRYDAMLTAIEGVEGCRFVAVPDVVAHAWWTTALFWQWRERVATTGQPPAFVIQDGQPGADVPWDAIGCLFVGGTTEYKLSAEAERLVREAKRRGLWVHVGRVNSRKRLAYSRAIGADSVDGTSTSRFRHTYIPLRLRQLAEPLQERLSL